MTGTVILTGGNGSLGLPFVQTLIKQHPEYTLVTTVRNTSQDKDQNTKKLFSIISASPGAKVHVEQLDLGVLDSVRSFADSIAKRVASGALPPVAAIVCNAFHWSLNGVKYTPDGYEASFQVSHLSHYLLVLKLVESMSPTGARIVMLGSGTHDPDIPNPLMKYPSGFPKDMEELLKPAADEAGEENPRGFQRYGTAKLANIAFMLDLNREFEKNPKLSHITALAMDPGGLIDSRAHTEQKWPVRTVFSVINLLMPILKNITILVRTSSDSAKDLVELSVGPKHASNKGYFLSPSKTGTVATIAQDKEASAKLWNACWRWVGMSDQETPLRPL